MLAISRAASLSWLTAESACVCVCVVCVCVGGGGGVKGTVHTSTDRV